MPSQHVKNNMVPVINDIKILDTNSRTHGQITEQKVPIEVKQISWKDTPNFMGNPYNMVANLRHICGEEVYGNKRGKEVVARKFVSDYLELSAKMDVYKCIEEGDIISTPPTQGYLVHKLVETGKRALSYYSNLPYEQTDVRDIWAEDARTRLGAPMNKSVPLQARVLNRSGKRFIAKKITPEDTVIDMVKNSRGMLAEGFVVSFLNSGLNCPECKMVGHIGWCDGMSHRSVDAFRDAVCMNCHRVGVITLFEIKTRWEKIASSCGNGTYAGSFVALNTLMTIKANVYLVMVSRDTGDVRIGKITSAKMRGNHNWLYALQEGFKWGSPSSYVICAGGFVSCPVKMTPLIETIPDALVDRIAREALMIIGL